MFYRWASDAAVMVQFFAPALFLIALFPIHLDLETDRQAWDATARLAERHRLTLYDAAYLELALRLGLPLATLDRELRATASGEKVKVLGE
jgi:predicted nucleic acid-binding protein